MPKITTTSIDKSLREIFSDIFILYNEFTADKADVDYSGESFVYRITDLRFCIEPPLIPNFRVTLDSVDAKKIGYNLFNYVKNITQAPENFKEHNRVFFDEVSPLLTEIDKETEALEHLKELIDEGASFAKKTLGIVEPRSMLPTSNQLKTDDSLNAAGLGFSDKFFKNEKKSDDVFPDLELGLPHQERKLYNSESIKLSPVVENKKGNAQKIEDMTMAVDDIFMRIKYNEQSAGHMEIKQAVDALKNQIDEDYQARLITLKQARILAVSTGQFLYAVTSDLKNSLNEIEKHNRPSNNTLRKKLKNSINKAKNNYLSDVNQISKHSRMLTIALWGLIGVALAGTVGLLLLGVEVSGSIATTIAIIEAVEVNAFIGAIALSLTGFLTGAYVGVKNKNNDTSTILLLTLAGGALGIAAGLFTLGFGAVYLNLAGNILNTVISASKLHLAGIGLASGATFLTALSCGFWQTSNPNKQIESKARDVEDKVSSYFWGIANRRIPVKINLEPGRMSRFLFKYGF